MRCSKGVQRRTGYLCMSGGPGQKHYGGGSLAPKLFSVLWFPSPFIDDYLAPLLKRHRNARLSHQHLLELNTACASVSCLWNFISLKYLYQLSQLWTNWLLLPDNLSRTASVLGLCWESSFWIKRIKKGWMGVGRGVCFILCDSS